MKRVAALTSAVLIGAMGLCAAPAAAESLPTNPKPGESWTDSFGITFCWCPPGKATITDEQGKHEVTFEKGFWLAKHELTSKELKACSPKTGVGKEFEGFPTVPDQPVVTAVLNSLRRVTYELNDFASTFKTNVKNPAPRTPGPKSMAPAGWQYALPTEAEWEYACRAGSTAAYSFGDDPKELPYYANFADKSLLESDESLRYADHQLNDGAAKPAKVGQYKPNAWGLHDMHGNAWEFCENGVARGGAWCSTPEDCRADSRTDQYSANVERMQRPWLGVRLVLRSNP